MNTITWQIACGVLHIIGFLLPSCSSCKSFFGTGLDSFTAFASPNYPAHYPPNQDCVRVIQARKGYDILITFRQFFQIEKSYEAQSVHKADGVLSNCPNDFIEFRDGRYGFSPLIGRFCGSQAPKEEIRATSGYIWIRFHSDEILEYKGFYADYSMVASREQKWKPDECHIEYQHALDGYVDSQSLPTTINFLRFPNINKKPTVASVSNQTGSLDCVWRVEVSLDLQIALYVEQFDLASPNQCSNNFLEVYSGTTSDAAVKRYCGLTANNVFSGHNVMFIRFFISDVKLLKSTHIRALYSSYAKHKNCTLHNMFACGDENCVPSALACNGRNNCPYRKDEQMCTVARDALVEFFSSGYSPLVLIILVVLVVVALLFIWTFKISSCTKAKKRRSYLNDLSHHPPPGIVIHSSANGVLH